MDDAGATVLVADDDAGVLQTLSMSLSAAGYRISTASMGGDALIHVATDCPRLLITDIGMQGADGINFVDAIRDQYPTLPIIVLTANDSIPDAVDALKHGVFSYLAKPCETERLLAEVARAINLAGGAMMTNGETWRRGIVTRNATMHTLLDQVEQVAEGDASVLIQGPSGSGKELLAKAVHLASPRHDKPFMGINCSAIPEHLLESELFGFTRGAFTGATRDHAGLFQEAEGGTLFLDEVGDMPHSLQVKLLRVLQEREIRPLGAVHTVPIDVRIVSATLRDLTEEVAAGRFRNDLFYRLNVVTLKLPGLCERVEDIPLLASMFLQDLACKYAKSIGGFAPEAMELLMRAPWPGNVRQLYNTVERAVALSIAPVIPATLLKNVTSETGEISSFGLARMRFEQNYLIQLLRITGGRVTRAAHLAQRNRTYFYKLLQRHQLDPEKFK